MSPETAPPSMQPAQTKAPEAGALPAPSFLLPEIAPRPTTSAFSASAGGPPRSEVTTQALADQLRGERESALQALSPRGAVRRWPFLPAPSLLLWLSLSHTFAFSSRALSPSSLPPVPSRTLFSLSPLFFSPLFPPWVSSEYGWVSHPMCVDIHSRVSRRGQEAAEACPFQCVRP